jgi:riboflavin kinase/FMN adenylyltransferase
MRVIWNLEDARKLEVSRLTWGSFDGVHLGHRRIISKLNEKGDGLLITFEPHPKKVLSPHKPFFFITLLDEKLSLLKECGVSNVLVLPFNLSLAEIEPYQFVRLIVERTDTKEVVVGENHRFGKERKGTPKILKAIGREYEFNVIEVPSLFLDGVKVSSTRIRKSLSMGNTCIAARLLGRYYSLTGEVVQGRKRGRKIGYPTANLDIPDEKFLPMEGVYACMVQINEEKLKGVMNIGARPTFKDDKGCEVHILDFDANIIGEKITVSIVKFLRRNTRFESPDKLKKMIGNDIKNARRILNSLPPG